MYLTNVLSPKSLVSLDQLVSKYYGNVWGGSRNSIVDSGSFPEAPKDAVADCPLHEICISHYHVNGLDIPYIGEQDLLQLARKVVA